MRLDGVARSTHAVVGYRSQTRSEMVKFLPADCQTLKVLEIGCGEGAFGASIVSGTEVWGIDPDSRSAAIAAGRLFRVLATTFDTPKPKLSARYFDLVVCNDVIEHMVDHEAFLASIQDYMAPGASLVGSIPNAGYYKNLFNVVVARDWEYQDSGILDRTHLRFFTMKSLRRSLEQAGFVVERLEGVTGGIHFA